MIDLLKESLWKQFGASIDMLQNAITLWPDESWHTRKKGFYMAYHCLVFLEYYLTNPPPPDFTPALPYTTVDPIEDEDLIDDMMPSRMYSKAELLDYLQACREKCRQVIAGLTLENLDQRWIERSDRPRNYAMVELLLYNMRHVQHHAAQLNMLLRQQFDDAPGWISRAHDAL